MPAKSQNGWPFTLWTKWPTAAYTITQPRQLTFLIEDFQKPQKIYVYLKQNRLLHLQGFARYSTDRKWHVPHFEKMLYDQAQLAVTYSNAYLITKNKKYADVVRDILTYVSRDLSHPVSENRIHAKINNNKKVQNLYFFFVFRY